MSSNAEFKALSTGWGRLANAIARTEEILSRKTKGWGSALDPVERAEAYDYWAQVLTFGLRREFHYRTTDHPLFHRIGLDTKIGFDNPDNAYQIAMIDPGHAYKVSGDLGDAKFIEISVSVGFPGVVVPPRTIGKLDTTELEIGPDGSIEVQIGGEKSGPNWIPLESDASSVLVRQVFGNWKEDARCGDFRIVRLEGEGERSEPFTPALVADRLERTAEFYEKQVTYWLDYADKLVERIDWNSFENPGQQGKEITHVNGARAFFSWGLWDLEDDEALLVTMKAPPPGAYLGVHLNNYWLQSLDYAGRITSLNDEQVHVDDDGIIRYVFAHRDPGVPNWMDVGDHKRGAILFRTALTDKVSIPEARLVKLADVRSLLPANTPEVRPEQRAAEIAKRRAHVASRFRW